MAKTLLEIAYEAIFDSSFGGGIKWLPDTEAELQEDLGEEILKLAKKQGITSWQQFASKVDLPASEVEAIWNGQSSLISLEYANKIAQGLGLRDVRDIIFEICLEDEL